MSCERNPDRNRKLKKLSDDELLRHLSEILGQSRRVESELVAHIGEVDQRRLYAREASPSMFSYCTEVLHLSEAEAYLRIAAARAAREHPMLLDMLADGRLHLTGIAKLAPQLTRANRDELLERAAHKTKRQIEELLAEIAPKPDVPSRMRKLPERKTTSECPPPPSHPSNENAQLRPDGVAGPAAAEAGVSPSPAASVPNEPPASRPDASGNGAPPRVATQKVEPLGPRRYKVEFTASAELHDKLQRLRALMRTQVPEGDLATLIEIAVTEKLERLESRRFGKTKSPRKTVEETDTTPSTRHIPAPVRRAVYQRDGNRCTFVDTRGQRCTARDGLEFHHDDPYGRGGDHSIDNVRLMCRVHNAYQAERDYGREKMRSYRRSSNGVCEPAPVYGVQTGTGRSNSVRTKLRMRAGAVSARKALSHASA